MAKGGRCRGRIWLRNTILIVIVLEWIDNYRQIKNLDARLAELHQVTESLAQRRTHTATAIDTATATNDTIYSSTPLSIKKYPLFMNLFFVKYLNPQE